jgi:hypothetical protein
MIFHLVQDFTDVLEAMPSDHPRRRILKLLDEAVPARAGTAGRLERGRRRALLRP